MSMPMCEGLAKFVIQTFDMMLDWYPTYPTRVLDIDLSRLEREILVTSLM